MIVKRLVALLVVSLAGVGCGTAAPVTDARGGRGLVYVGTDSGIAAFEGSSGIPRWIMPGALAGPNYARVYSLDGSAAPPVLASHDPATGARLGAVQVDPGFVPRVASTSGASVALVRRGASRSYGSARSRTRIQVARPERAEVESFDLDGNFEPEAFSTDDRKLFLIEHLEGAPLGRYRVRMMRLASGRILPVGRLTKVAPDSMLGTRREQVYSPAGDVLYTLYTKQPPNDAHRSTSTIQNREAVHAFVHVLNLREGWAHCVDLPMPFGMGSETSNVLAVSPYGRFLYAGDAQRVAVVDLQRLRVIRVSGVTLGASGSPRAAVGADEHLYVGSGSTLDVFDGPGLAPLGRLQVPGPLSALTVTADGNELLVGAPGGVSVLDSDSGEAVVRIAADPAESLAFRER
jgi:hypothetical protein